MCKIVLVVLASVLLLASGVLSAPQEESTNNILIKRLIQVREDVSNATATETETDTSVNSIINNIVKLIINAVLAILVTAGCSVIAPYLTIAKLFQSTVLSAIILILQFASITIGTFWADGATQITEAVSGVNWLSTELASTLNYVSNLGCTI